MANELKPCPFCGGKPKPEDYGRGRAAVSCSNCFVRTRLGCNAEDMSLDWNARVNAQPKPTGDVGELVEQLKHSASVGTSHPMAKETMLRAADAITALHARVQELETKWVELPGVE